MKEGVNDVEDPLFLRIREGTVIECDRRVLRAWLAIVEAKYILNNRRAKMTSTGHCGS